MSHQAIICSYEKDFPWLPHCLYSLKKFGKNFLPPVVCVDTADFDGALEIVNANFPEASVVIKDGRPGAGFMRAQIAMMTADVICPEADTIHFIGSDCIAIQELDAKIYNDEHDKPVVLFTPYNLMGNHPWGRGTQEALGFLRPPEFEFMRRLPSVFPRSIFAPMRQRVEEVHKKSFEDYIHEANARHRDVSEANILGAFAFRFMADTCRWVRTDTDDLRAWPSYLGQHWSHGGLDRPTDACYNYTVDGVTQNASGQTPRSLIQQILYS